MSEDVELELLKHRALKKRMQEALRGREEGQVADVAAEDPRSIVASRLVGRGAEVLQAAEEQYPQVAAAVVRELAKLIKQGRIEEAITGEELYSIFLSLGFRVRLPTKIYYEKHGERRGLSDLIRERLSSEGS
ncbi:MAG: double-stranded DNA-binding protein [Candidatus Nezhaarchaeota archaeon]|nr:double-stranded DNA-binding protein [Candidatus Nezhaarchaeota archaeon]